MVGGPGGETPLSRIKPKVVGGSSQQRPAGRGREASDRSRSLASCLCRPGFVHNQRGATAVLNDSTGGCIGIVTRSSALVCDGARPGPSPPMSTAIGPRRSGVEERPAAARRGGDDAAAVTARFVDRFADVPVDENRQPQGAAHRPAKRLPAERIGACAGADDAARATGFRDAHDRADISRILYVNRHEHQGVVAISAAAGLDGRSARATTDWPIEPDSAPA